MTKETAPGTSLAYAPKGSGVHMPEAERVERSLTKTMPAHIPALTTAKIDAVSRSRIRRAWAELTQGNIEDVERWLHQVATGIRDEEGRIITNPNPREAILLFIEMAKFTTPQVKAVSIDMNDGKSIKRMSIAELEASIVGDGS
jgi:hypothetical protein